jgi:hypothetical protein
MRGEKLTGDKEKKNGWGKGGKEWDEKESIKRKRK